LIVFWSGISTTLNAMHSNALNYQQAIYFPAGILLQGEKYLDNKDPVQEKVELPLANDNNQIIIQEAKTPDVLGTFSKFLIFATLAIVTTITVLIIKNTSNTPNVDMPGNIEQQSNANNMLRELETKRQNLNTHINDVINRFQSITNMPTDSDIAIKIRENALKGLEIDIESIEKELGSWNIESIQELIPVLEQIRDQLFKDAKTVKADKSFKPAPYGFVDLSALDTYRMKAANVENLKETKSILLNEGKKLDEQINTLNSYYSTLNNEKNGIQDTLAKIRSSIEILKSGIELSNFKIYYETIGYLRTAALSAIGVLLYTYLQVIRKVYEIEFDI
jgi:DNA repair exonuclease SbcCD ATPase subunit